MADFWIILQLIFSTTSFVLMTIWIYKFFTMENPNVSREDLNKPVGETLLKLAKKVAYYHDVYVFLLLSVLFDMLADIIKRYFL